MDKSMQKMFREPVSEYGPVLFWSLNDKLTDEELAYQIEEMGKQKVGGFFMHARIGLATPYLSDEWMARIKNCIETAKKTGTYAWLYDEDKYPSGFAGGLVTDKNEEFKSRTFVYEKIKPADLKEQQNTLQTFIIKENANHSYNYKPINPDNYNQLNQDDEILVFKTEVSPSSPWFNGSTYIDSRNPDAVKKFIQTTYESYADLFQDEFGKTVPGIFTDEPHFNGFYGWTRDFIKTFKEKKNYDLLDVLPALILNTENSQKIRYDYWDCATEMFLENFCKPIYDWCEEHNLQFTGHFWEHGLPVQLGVGSVMPCYEYMQIPGIDCLGHTRNFEKYVVPQFGNVVMHKEVSSVGNQLEKKRILSESFGGAGWDFDFNEQKLFVNFQLVLGINLINPHLSLYSLRGYRKRDFPISFSYHQPWWKYYHKINLYITRLCQILSQGTFLADIMVIHPMGSSWLLFKPDEELYNPSDPKPIELFDKNFRQLAQSLMELHYSYDFGDEHLMAKFAIVENGRLKLHQGSYKTVIIPSCLVLKKSTLKLLQDFAEQGGDIISIKPFPSLIEGEESEELHNFLNQERITVVEDKKEELHTALKTVQPSKIEILNSDGVELSEIFYHERVINNQKLFFFVNLSPDNEIKAKIKIPGFLNFEQLDPETGEIKSLNCSQQNDKTIIEWKFNPAGELLVYEASEPVKNNPVKFYETKETIKFNNSWDIKKHNENVLVLDCCQYKVNDEDWSENVSVWKVQKKLRKHFDFDEITYCRSLQPWKARTKIPETCSEVSLKFQFNNQINSSKSGQICLIAERAEKFKITLNGTVLESKTSDFWLDSCFKKIPLTTALNNGENEIELSCNYNSDIELENIYLIGDFAVTKKGANDFILTGETGKLKTGDWCKQGFPFYAGTISYLQEIEVDNKNEDKFILDFDNISACGIRIIVNNCEAGICCWQPYQIDVTDLIKDGNNIFEFEVTNSLRNLFGPHHNTNLDYGLVSTGQFVNEEDWIDSYIFKEYGIIGDLNLNIVR